jgi:hypothetical protein
MRLWQQPKEHHLQLALIAKRELGLLSFLHLGMGGTLHVSVVGENGTTESGQR